ncbi:MAG: homogentisate 1,2-dioxygenase [Betaproteobacteria bacterium]
MPYFMRIGDTPRKRFSQHRREDGRLYAAEVMGEEGFSSDMSMLYHRETPSAVLHVEAVAAAAPDLAPNHPLAPRLFDTAPLPRGGDMVGARQLLCGNTDVLVAFASADTASPLYRNAIGDELIFVHDGSARLETVFGALEVGKGDYVVIPKATTHRWLPGTDGPLNALVFETTGHVRPPKRYLTRYGQYHQEAPYSELDLRRPEAPLLVEGKEVAVLVKTAAGLTRYTYQTHPFDVAGWFGCNYPYALNIADFSPISGSFHRPPPVHQVFEAPGCVFCNFVPRMLDYDPRAMPVPSYHSNVDSDEFIFYAEGNFFSRKGSGIGRGAISLHPAGHIHGPQPAAWESGPSRVGQRTEETAVMLDTFKPLALGPAARATERADYVLSWNHKP